MKEAWRAFNSAAATLVGRHIAHWQRYSHLFSEYKTLREAQDEVQRTEAKLTKPLHKYATKKRSFEYQHPDAQAASRAREQLAQAFKSLETAEAALDKPAPDTAVLLKVADDAAKNLEAVIDLNIAIVRKEEEKKAAAKARAVAKDEAQADLVAQPIIVRYREEFYGGRYYCLDTDALKEGLANRLGYIQFGEGGPAVPIQLVRQWLSAAYQGDKNRDLLIFRPAQDSVNLEVESGGVRLKATFRQPEERWAKENKVPGYVHLIRFVEV